MTAQTRITPEQVQTAKTLQKLNAEYNKLHARVLKVLKREESN